MLAVPEEQALSNLQRRISVN